MSRSDKIATPNRVVDIDYVVTPLGALTLKIGSSGKTLVATESSVMVIIDSKKKKEFKRDLRRLLKQYDTGDFTF